MAPAARRHRGVQDQVSTARPCTSPLSTRTGRRRPFWLSMLSVIPLGQGRRAIRESDPASRPRICVGGRRQRATPPSYPHQELEAGATARRALARVASLEIRRGGLSAVGHQVAQAVYLQAKSMGTGQQVGNSILRRSRMRTRRVRDGRTPSRRPQRYCCSGRPTGFWVSSVTSSTGNYESSAPALGEVMTRRNGRATKWNKGKGRIMALRYAAAPHS